jgi:rod shape-determining protein MreC
MHRERRVANYLFLLYVCVSVVILGASLSEPVIALRVSMAYLWNPVPSFGSQTAERLTGIPQSVAHLLSADSENRSLKEDLKQLSWAESQIASLRRENERLRIILGVKPTNGRILRWARVMERDSLNWYRYLVIDEGKEDGIEINAPVLGVEGGRLGVVGRITEMGPRWAKVLLVTDELSSIAAYIPSKQWEGLIEGEGKEQLLMNYLPIEASFAIGDLVYTSVTSPTFPPDILIGSVIRVFPQDPFLTFRSVAVSPAIHAEALKEVAIMMPLKGQPISTP